MGIDIASGRESEMFKWFLASFLFGKRISQNIAANKLNDEYDGRANACVRSAVTAAS